MRRWVWHGRALLARREHAPVLVLELTHERPTRGDMRTIAAAPQMYEALKAVENFFAANRDKLRKGFGWVSDQAYVKNGFPDTMEAVQKAVLAAETDPEGTTYE